MATRIKKQPPNSKEVASPQTTTFVKNDLPIDTPKSTAKGQNSSEIVRRIVATRSPSKRIIKRTAAALKAKVRQSRLRINPNAIADALEENDKKLPAVTKKALLKNGVKSTRPRLKKIKEEPADEQMNDDVTNVVTKKRVRKPKLPGFIDIKRIKTEPVEQTESDTITDKINDLISEAVETTKKPLIRKPRQRKPKIQATEASIESTINSTIEDVMSDLSFLIKEGDIKKEADDSLSESSDSFKLKKLTNKQRLDILKNEIKKENIENTFSKLNDSERTVINMLDLSVKNLKPNSAVARRRHSIEKFPLSSENISTESVSNLFNQLPRCISPRTSKRNPRIRQSLDGVAPRRRSPYSTRSENPTRLLRNGKNSKMQGLLPGVEGRRRRKRKASDVANDMAGKVSEYDSDSSYSDMASLHGSEKETDILKPEEGIDEFSSLETKVEEKPTQESISNEKNVDLIDTNSNLCCDIDSHIPEEPIMPKAIIEEDLPSIVSPSCKVPEKSLILDSMKQMFNEKDELGLITPGEYEVIGKIEKEENIEDIVEHKEELLEKKDDSLPPLEGFDFEDELNSLLAPKVQEKVVSIKAEEFPESDDFACEEKEAEEQRSFENIVQECIESIEDTKTAEQNTLAPRLPDHPVEDGVPVIENMAEMPVSEEIVEHLEPPQLERSVVEHAGNTTLFVDSEKNGHCEDNENMEVDPLASEDQNMTEEKNLEDQNMTEEEKNELKQNWTDSECDKLPEASEHLENTDKTDLEKVEIETKVIIHESPEELQRKESMLSALGLQSKNAPLPRQSKRERQHKQHDDYYTGTLKTVIKINRDKKRGKNSFKMTLHKNNKVKTEIADQGSSEDGHKYLAKEGPSTSAWKQVKESSDSAGAHRKTHNSNRSNTEGSSEHTSDGESQTVVASGDTPDKALLIPEKASSFSIHPGRLCKDECSYCFGKFGLFDTPCHIAQLKSVERQNKILETEKHLTRDSCLCDACYRHVDRKANTPSYTNKSFKRNSLVAPGPRQNHCHVLGCNNVSSNILRRKWIMKMRKSICQRINIDLDNPGLHSIPICDEHYTALEHLMICAMCKRHLAKNHIHYLGPEVKELNSALNDEDIPIQLSDRPVVCKLCKCFTSVILKDPEERPENSVAFFEEYKKRLLHFNDIVPMDAAQAEEPIIIPSKNDSRSYDKEKDMAKKKKRSRNHSGESKDSHDGENGDEGENRAQNRATSTDTNQSQSQSHSRSESPDDEEEEYASIDYNALIPAINLECPSDSENNKKELQQFQRKMVIGMPKKIPRLESMKDALQACKGLRAVRHHKPNDLAVQKLGQNPSISLRPAYPNYQDKDAWEKCGNLGTNTQISVRQLFPGEEELPLLGHVDFNNVKERTPEGWAKCTSTIQYDEETKHLWHELQKPYGNQSSFLRHLILLEKYFRNGDLILSPNATHHAINYRESVTNRLRAYDNIPSNAPPNVHPISMMSFNKMRRSQSGIITSFHGSTALEKVPNGSGHSVTISQIPSNGSSGGSVSAKSTPITLQQLNSPPLLPTNTILQNLSGKPKTSGTPPGLISIQSGSARPQINPVALAAKPQPHSQKIKFPITKNWRPNLIPIDPSKKQERKTGLVQVISGGKPYHITLEDYKKMCAIKRSFEAKQKKLQEQQLAHKQLQQQHAATGGQLQPAAVLVQHNSVLKQQIIPKKGLLISKSGGIVSETKPILATGGVVSVTPSVTLTGIPPTCNAATSVKINVVGTPSAIPATVASAEPIGSDQGESILDKLDRAVEKLGPADRSELLPRIPKSLTVIPQTVRKTIRPPSPILMITQKPTNPSNVPNNSTNINQS